MGQPNKKSSCDINSINYSRNFWKTITILDLPTSLNQFYFTISAELIEKI